MNKFYLIIATAICLHAFSFAEKGNSKLIYEIGQPMDMPQKISFEETKKIQEEFKKKYTETQQIAKKECNVEFSKSEYTDEETKCVENVFEKKGFKVRKEKSKKKQPQ
jgi:uncharacterized Fe-S cluster protein YjdI